MGLCDLCGELTRKAVNSVIAENYSLVLEIKDFITQLHEDLELFSLSGELRKKFDSIKYHLSKLEDIVLRLKLSDKI